MTDREKAIVMAYTGVCMLSGDKFKIFHEYIENIMDRPVYTHELADRSVENEIKEKAKADFIALCEEQEPKTGHWIDIMVGDMPAQACDRCNTFYPLAYTGGGHKYCPNCGAKMIEPQERSDKE